MTQENVKSQGAILKGHLVLAKSDLKVFDPQFAVMETRAKEMEIKTDQDQVQAVEMAAQAKKLGKKIEAIKNQYIKEPNDFVKSVRALAKTYADRLTSIEADLKRKIAAHQVAKEAARRQAEKEARRAAESMNKLQAEAEAAGLEPPVEVVAVTMPPLEKSVHTLEGSASTRKIWTFQIVAPLEVPRNYLMIDEKAIRHAVKSGVREIPGVRIYQDTTAVIRT